MGFRGEFLVLGDELRHGIGKLGEFLGFGNWGM